jgi:eukaryotic-like serine/threonine-protein kinase
MVSEAATGPLELGPGRWLGRYELVYPLGRGGMAEVWLAKLHGPHGFERLVALKTILPSFADEVRFRSMFVNEAKIAAGIEHVNVAHIWDLDEQAGLLFLAMEWVDGDSLQELERAAQRASEALPISVLLRIMADVCAGLHAAHELRDLHGKSLNVVHRDVSPQNILISAAGVAKLIDFGVAKAVRRRSEDTATGIIKGKLQYMAPEQALGRPLDRRADIWAVGATLYRLLARRPLFLSTGPKSAIERLSSPAPPEPLPSSVPSALSSIVLRALAFEPARRYPTAAELGRALEELSCSPNHATSEDVASCLARYRGSALSARREAVSQALAALGASETTAAHARQPLLALASMPQQTRPSSSSRAALVAQSMGPAPAMTELFPVASSPTREETTRPLVGVAPPSSRPGNHRRKTRAPAIWGVLTFGGSVAWLLASSSGGPPPAVLAPSVAVRTASPSTPPAVAAAVSVNSRFGPPALPTLPPVLEASEPLPPVQRKPVAEPKPKRGARGPVPRKRAPSRVVATPPPAAIAAPTAHEVIDDGF